MYNRAAGSTFAVDSARARISATTAPGVLAPDSMAPAHAACSAGAGSRPRISCDNRLAAAPGDGNAAGGGVTVFDAVENGPVPIAFRAATSNRYNTPARRLVTTSDVP